MILLSATGKQKYNKDIIKKRRGVNNCCTMNKGGFEDLNFIIAIFLFIKKVYN